MDRERDGFLYTFCFIGTDDFSTMSFRIHHVKPVQNLTKTNLCDDEVNFQLDFFHFTLLVI